jgi:hypothetical protein
VITQSSPLASVLRRDAVRTAAAIAALTVIVTHPLACRAWRVLPGDLGDPVLNAFLLGWGSSRMPFAFSGVWSAPFYFPLEGTLALSEHLLGITVFVAPIVWMTGNPVFAQNVAFLGSYVLAGTGMYLLARTLWGRRDAAFLAALAFAFAPHRVMHVSHLQVLMSGWMPVSLWGLHRYFATGSRRALAVFAAAFVALALSNGYFLYFFSIPVALVVACELMRASFRGEGPGRTALPWRTVAELAVAAGMMLAAIAPAALAYMRVRREFGFHRALQEMAAFGATWSDYLRAPGGLWRWSGVLEAGDGERMLFPGLTIVALAAVAAVTLRRSHWPQSAPRPAGWAWQVGLYAAILVAAAWLSAGPAVTGPYQLLLAALPGFDGLRVPARLVVVVALALCVLGAAGAAWLFSRMRPRAATAACVVLGAALMFEGYGGPVPTVPFSHEQRDRRQLNDWIRTGPAGGVLELPVVGPAFEPFTLVYQYNTLLHRHPVVNGYSGYGYGLQDFLGGPGSPLTEPAALPGLIEGLQGIGVRYLVLHQQLFANRPDLGWRDPKDLVASIDEAAGQQGRQMNTSVGWLLGPPRARLPVDESALERAPLRGSMLTASAMPDRLQYVLDGDVETRWRSEGPQAGGEWIRVAFETEIDAGRLVILTSRFGVGDYPRGLEVESEAADGSRLALFSGSFLPSLIGGLATGKAGAPAIVDLPSNRSRALWIRQTGRSQRWWWAVCELQVYRRRPR